MSGPDDTNLLNLVMPLPKLTGKNASFFKHYGHPDDPNSFLAKSKVFTVRHAQSEENVVCDGEVPVLQCYPYEEHGLTDEIIYTRMLDAQLSDLGVQQSKELQPLANEFQFPEDTVYCSPHRRTVYTLCHMLMSHPQKNRLKIVMLPLAKEALCGFGSIPLLIKALKKEYSETVIG